MIGWYARRAVAWLPLLACTALGALFGVVELSRSSGWEPLAYALFGLVPACACVVDEPAGAVVDSGAATLRWRTAARACALLVPVSSFGLLVLWVAGRPGAPTALLLADGWILMGLAFASTVVLRRAGHESPSRLAAPAAVIALTADLMLTRQAPAALRLLNVQSHIPWLRLGLLGALVAILAVWGSRDLLARPLSLQTVIGVRRPSGAQRVDVDARRPSGHA
jgi:hypothetical protein